MATKKPVVVGNNQHVGLADGDTLPAAALPLSATAGNIIQSKADGLFAQQVPPAISAAAGNRVQGNADGLFVPAIATTDIPISKTQGNVIVAMADGLFANPAAPTLPYYRWEVGHSAQQNGGLGIDMGSWYRLDMRIGADGSLPVTFDSDGYVVLPAGIYLAFSGAHVMSQPNAGAQVENWQASFMFEQAYGFPGVYQTNSLYYKRVDTLAEDFTMAVSDVRSGGGANSKTCFGFSKTSTHTVKPQGYIGIVKIG
ncbi:hypothetical protein [Burkholderia metallica]|uniref:hypothetical protein n=1 Tax=Burkholderia metallica TaxID=488729 RepID=UPI001CF157F5|nr:hypothetical protein [Burkholderia metallica]MCA8017740.1 hypothetical protein [Burkholderia metallica]